jgi:hypothetical protein
MVKLNSKGPEVAKVQQMLKMLGHKVATDGDFGVGTLAAVHQFQKQAGFSANGVVTGDTEAALLNATATQRAKLISMDDLHKGAQKINVAPEALLAVRDVESLGYGFLGSGKAVILFEGHVFWNKLRKAGADPAKYQAGNEDVLYPSFIAGNPVYKKDQHARLEKAAALNIPGVDVSSLAHQSASWGLFQIMGFHHAKLGFQSVHDFCNSMNRSENDQFDIFLRFLQAENMLDDLRALRWANFARRYNGEKYAENRYDVRLASFYNKHLGVESTGREVELPDDGEAGRPFGVDAQFFE